MNIDILITGHVAIAEMLKDMKVIDNKTQVLENIEGVDIDGKVVAGNIPYEYACKCKHIVEVNINLPSSLRHIKELTKDDVLEYFKGISVYRVDKIAEWKE